MKRHLFDVNLLLALSDPDHEHHRRVREWLDEHRVAEWASCPITQNGFVRIASQPGYPGHVSAPAAIRALRIMTADIEHEFWPDDISIGNAKLIEAESVSSHKRVTDTYLIALAKARGGVLLTLDGRISPQAVSGDANACLAIIA